MNSFANKITKNRKKLGFTKKTVANLVQCSETYIGNIENKGVVPEDVLTRHANDERFLTLLHNKQPYGWQAEGPDYDLMARNPRGLYD